MNLCWMNYLGLHNKPKGEVHLEHMRTGPREEEEEESASQVYNAIYSFKYKIWNIKKN